MFSSVAQKSFSPKENLKHFLSSWGFQHALSDAQNNWTKVLGACHNNINLNRHPYLLNTDFRLSWLFSCFLQKLSLETVPYFFFYSWSFFEYSIRIIFVGCSLHLLFSIWVKGIIQRVKPSFGISHTPRHKKSECWATLCLVLLSKWCVCSWL